jgi:putative hemolysin
MMSASCPSTKLIDLKRHISSPAASRFVHMVAPPLEKILALSSVNHMYSCLQQRGEEQNFFESCIDYLNIHVRITDGDLEKIPAYGALMVVCNHPFGALDGIILGWLLNRARSDAKIIGNYFLHNITEMRSSIIPVDPFQTKNSVARNLEPMKQAIAWLRAGGTIGMFPAGEVAHWDVSRRRITDPPWSQHAAALIQRTRATVVPVHFSGRNSLAFQVLGLLHARLRTVMLPRELMKKKSTEITLAIGRPIPYSAVEHLSTREALTRYLRLHTCLLASRTTQQARKNKKLFSVPIGTGEKKHLAEPVGSQRLMAEIAGLPPDRLLLQHGAMQVFAADSAELPNALREIGRLREEAFRSVGEGTGRALDLDGFDSYYRHIFLWDAGRAQIAGAYRIGHTDEILARLGRKGLYTSTLFQLKKSFFSSLGPALELGRSFISPEYQKQYNALSMLWKGIGQYVVRNPGYVTLFGPVSISNEYHRVSKDLMIRFLRRMRSDGTLCRSVTARNPVRTFPFRELPESIDELTFENISAIISDIEHDGKGIPVLLRHYLRLHAAIVGFNLDASFSRVIDGLLVVDLLRTDPRLLKRFLGNVGFDAFMSHAAGRQPDLIVSAG